jgi:hypothetical protein
MKVKGIGQLSPPQLRSRFLLPRPCVTGVILTGGLASPRTQKHLLSPMHVTVKCLFCLNSDEKQLAREGTTDDDISIPCYYFELCFLAMHHGISNYEPRDTATTAGLISLSPILYPF